MSLSLCVCVCWVGGGRCKCCWLNGRVSWPGSAEVQEKVWVKGVGVKLLQPVGSERGRDRTEEKRKGN